MLDTQLLDVTASDWQTSDRIDLEAPIYGSEVLIVEDNPDIQCVLSLFLRALGYRCAIVTDGAAAIALIESSLPPAIVLLDRKLPRVTGDVILKKIRNTPTWSSTPVIIVSGVNDFDEMCDLMEAGASGYLVKPFRPVEVARMIQKIS